MMEQKLRDANALPQLLRQSLGRVLVQERDGPSNEITLRRALREVCARARGDGIRAEHLLIVLKGSWRTLPERGEVASDASDEALSRVVSACIKEYYQDRIGSIDRCEITECGEAPALWLIPSFRDELNDR